MRHSLFHIRLVPGKSIQAQIRERLVADIVDGRLVAGTAMPSSRRLAEALGVSRNTVVLVYEHLVDDGFLTSRQRSGYFVAEGIQDDRAPGPSQAPSQAPSQPHDGPDWERRFRVRPTRQSNVEKPSAWQDYEFPFVYGQVDLDLFPIGAWRECTRQALGRKEMAWWMSDNFAEDDEALVEQIRERLLPRRGIFVKSDEILVTLGAQNALYLIASLLVTPDATVGFEEPGYADARNIFGLCTQHVVPLAVDAGGLPVDERLSACQYLYTTPSHQLPTAVTLPMARREALLQAAGRHRFLIIEDDYESETNFAERPMPALKSLDEADRVLYVGSLSKVLFPGLRLGFLVGPPEFIAEARSLRRLMLRHPPTHTQRTAALFIALGHYDSLIRRLHKNYRQRWQVMHQALERHLPETLIPATFGGSCFWLTGPARLDADELAGRALAQGIIIEPGRVFFAAPEPPANHFRLGFSSIPEDRIEPGIVGLAELMRDQLRSAA